MTENVALFIDGDNVCRSTFQENFEEIKLRGRICIKRIYFDFNNRLDEKWKSIILSNGIESISVTNLPSKNSTDIRLMLDMIREYYNNQIITTYIIMSSDSDFYHISTFLRSCGKKVICYGENHTPLMLRNVCDEFVLCKKGDVNEKEIKDKENDNEEEKLYKLLRSIDPYLIDIRDIKDINVKDIKEKYNYYREYKNILYIIRELSNNIKFISKNKILENKNLSYLKDLLIQTDPSFSEKNWGFFSFKEFINTLFKNEITTCLDPLKKIEIISSVKF